MMTQRKTSGIVSKRKRFQYYMYLVLSNQTVYAM
ncbi:hypothetical protein ACHAXM_006474 [Skeletonema potamos]